MTFREIDLCLKRIDIRTHNNYAMRAQLHGYKIPLKEVSKVKESHVDEKKGEAAERAMQEAIKRRGMKKKGE